MSPEDAPPNANTSRDGTPTNFEMLRTLKSSKQRKDDAF